MDKRNNNNNVIDIYTDLDRLTYSIQSFAS